MSAGGTPESEWVLCAALNHAPMLSSESVLAGAGRLVVVAPHPDDETLSAGGLLAIAAERNCPTVIVAVTDGEASHDGSEQWTREALAMRRLDELNCALTRLGFADVTVVRLSLGDGRVSDEAGVLAGHLQAELRANDVVVCPWRWDGHPDHEATAAVVLDIAPAAGCRVLEAPIWMWHWRTPDCALIEWHRLVKIGLSPEVAQRKKSALAAFASQRERDSTLARTPIIDDTAIAHFERNFESFFDRAD